MLTQPIPFELSLAYTLIFFLAVLFGFWMGRMTVGESVHLTDRQPEYIADDEEDIFAEAMRDPDDDTRRSTI